MITQFAHGQFSRTTIGVAAWLTLALAGCGAPKATVSGKVTYKGKPLTMGSVVFSGKDNQIASGAIKRDGSYSVERVPVGSMKITVSTPAPPPTDSEPSDKGPTEKIISIPAKYSDPEKSGLTYDVKPGSQEYDIKLD